MAAYFLYFLGFLPSLIWLLFYLKKDAHPEPRGMVIKVFFLGMAIAFVAIVLERITQLGITAFNFNEAVNKILLIFLGGAIIEEFCKYLVVRIWVYKNKELDEPFDVILYMIISALGFAATENILLLAFSLPNPTISSAIGLMFVRFITATILHALASGLFGYFLVISFYRLREKTTLFLTGFLLASLLHGLYNFSIMKLQGGERISMVLLVFLFLISFAVPSIKKAKKLKSICLPNFVIENNK